MSYTPVYLTPFGSGLSGPIAGSLVTGSTPLLISLTSCIYASYVGLKSAASIYDCATLAASSAYSSQSFGSQGLYTQLRKNFVLIKIMK